MRESVHAFYDPQSEHIRKRLDKLHKDFILYYNTFTEQLPYIYMHVFSFYTTLTVIHITPHPPPHLAHSRPHMCSIYLLRSDVAGCGSIFPHRSVPG